MRKVKKILFPTDFSDCAEHAFKSAIKMAKRYDADLEVLHVSVLPVSDPYSLGYYYPDSTEAKHMLEKHVKNELKRTIQDQGIKDIKITTKQMTGLSPAPVILKYAKEQEFDMLVIGTHGRTGFRHAVLGSVAEEIVRLAPCSVMTVGSHYEAKSDAENKILVPIDFSSHSKTALANAKEFADRYNMSIETIHVIPNAFQIHPEGTEFNIFNSYPDILEETKASLKEMSDEMGGPEIVIDHAVTVGYPAVEICDYAKQHGHSLIMMPTHGITGIKKLLIGSVAEKVVRLAPCPVIVLK
ncbi:MAG: universal stress protein [Calditrichaeota bacterium]|nr:universal stress protein [Calditrichota bacterium]